MSTLTQPNLILSHVRLTQTIFCVKKINHDLLLGIVLCRVNGLY